MVRYNHNPRTKLHAKQSQNTIIEEVISGELNVSELWGGRASRQISDGRAATSRWRFVSASLQLHCAYNKAAPHSCTRCLIATKCPSSRSRLTFCCFFFILFNWILDSPLINSYNIFRLFSYIFNYGTNLLVVNDCHQQMPVLVDESWTRYLFGKGIWPVKKRKCSLSINRLRNLPLILFTFFLTNCNVCVPL